MGPVVGKLGVGLTWRSHYAIAAKYLMWFAYSLGEVIWLPQEVKTGQGGYYLTSQVGFRVEGVPSNNKSWKAWFLFVSRHWVGVSRLSGQPTLRSSREEGRGVPEVPRKRQAEDSADHRKKDRCKLHREADRSTAKGKGPADTKEEPPTPRWKPKLMRELCSASAGVDGWDYHAIQMCNLPERAPDTPLNIDLMPLTHGMQVWLDREASTRYIRGTLICD
ncbi:hypothetical protein BHE74_00034835 [Ensete ventricosum]|nr:hypothetical protein BHE74_00034835 [Ensete ventricosum]